MVSPLNILKKRKKRGALTISDLIYAFVAIIVLSQLMPIIRDYSSQAASQASGIEAVFWNMLPWIIVLGLIWTVVEKARTPRYEYEE